MRWHVTDELCVVAVRRRALVIVRGRLWEYVAEHLGQPPTFRGREVELCVFGSHSGSGSCTQSGRKTG